jgi:hypothetical protein
MELTEQTIVHCSIETVMRIITEEQALQKGTI